LIIITIYFLSIPFIKLFFIAFIYFSLVTSILWILYHLFYIVILPCCLSFDIYYLNGNLPIGYNQQEEIRKKKKENFKTFLEIYIVPTCFENKSVSIKKQYRQLVPLSLYFSILNLQAQKRTFRLDTTGIIFFLFIFILLLLFVFSSLTFTKEYHLDFYRDNANFLFFCALFVLMLVIFFGILLFKDKRDYYRQTKGNKLKKRMRFYRNYYLIDYVLDEKILEPQTIIYGSKENDEAENETLSLRNFTTIFIPLLFGIYASLVYNQIYTTDVVLTDIENSKFYMERGNHEINFKK